MTVDRRVPNDEAPFVNAWERMARQISVDPAFRPDRGAPPKRTQVPRLHVYSKVVATLYRRKLAQWGQDCIEKARERGEQLSVVPDAPREERRLLRQRARDEARKQIPKEACDTIPDGTREAVESEAPWRAAAGGPPTDVPPVG